MILNDLKNKIAQKINEILGTEQVNYLDFEYPDNSEMGDLSLPCFRLAKQLKNAPNALAARLAEVLQGVEEIAEVKAAGPYLNIFLAEQKICSAVLQEVARAGEKFGQGDVGGRKRVMVEYSNVNTHKEYHIGHLRNLSYGDAVVRLLSAVNYDVVPVSYINDFGIHAAKTLWAYLKYYKNEKLPENKGAFLGQVYVQAAKEEKDNPVIKEEIGVIMKKIEARAGEEYRLWQETREWSITQHAEIYKELDIKIEKVFYENEFIDEGIRLVDELLQKGILKVSEGAVIADLEEEGLGVMLFKRSDGTSLYPVADLSLARAKFEQYKLDESILVIDNRQSLHFKQLFRVLNKMGYQQKMKHLQYDFVDLPGGAMSSRTGNIITYEELKEKMLAKIITETRSRHADWSEDKIYNIAKVLAFGAMKFEMLKVGQDQVITFDMAKATETNGFTAAYLQYVYARISSILRKNSINNSLRWSSGGVGAGIDFNPKEKQLVLKIAKYQERVLRAAEDYDPSEIAKYLFELGQLFNDFYHTVPILAAEDEDTKNFRLELIRAVAQVIKNGLDLLGVGVVEEM